MGLAVVAHNNIGMSVSGISIAKVCCAPLAASPLTVTFDGVPTMPAFSPIPPAPQPVPDQPFTTHTWQQWLAAVESTLSQFLSNKRKESSGLQGVAVLVAGAVVVPSTAVTANTRILLTSQADGGVPGFLRITARVAGTSFTITSSNAGDTSTVAYLLNEPA